MKKSQEVHSTEPEFKCICVSNINRYITDTCLPKKRAIFYFSKHPPPPPDYSNPPRLLLFIAISNHFQPPPPIILTPRLFGTREYTTT